MFCNFCAAIVAIAISAYFSPAGSFQIVHVEITSFVASIQGQGAQSFVPFPKGLILSQVPYLKPRFGLSGPDPLPQRPERAFPESLPIMKNGSKRHIRSSEEGL